MMMSPPKLITDTSEIAAAEWIPAEEPGDISTDITATETAVGKPFEFHVQMNNFTLNEMENLVVEAAARLIVGNRRDESIAKAIELRCVELVNEKATKALEAVTTDIIDAPLTPNFGDKKPVTMREFIGLYGREYLTAKVDREGKPKEAGSWREETMPRIQYLVARSMDGRFQAEIEKATNAVVTEIRNSVRARHDVILTAEKKRFAEALAKAIKVDI